MKDLKYATVNGFGFEDAIVGIDMVHERVIYDKMQMVEILMKYMESYDEAIEFLQHNVWTKHTGKYTPIYMDAMDNDYLNEFLSQ